LGRGALCLNVKGAN